MMTRLPVISPEASFAAATVSAPFANLDDDGLYGIIAERYAPKMHCYSNTISRLASYSRLMISKYIFT